MGIYNGKSIYNGNAIYNGKSIYNGDALYKEDGSVLKETLFLSKFDNYNDAIQQDIPDVGDTYIFDPTKQSVKHTVVFLFDKYMNAIEDSYIQDDSVGFEKDIETKFLSSEAWIKINGNRDDYGVWFCIGPEVIVADPLFSQTTWGVFGPYLGNNNYTMLNGTTFVNSGGYIFAKFGTAPRDTWFFYSSVYDVDAKEIRYYINGDIMLIVKLNTDYEKWSFMLRQRNTGKNTQIAYAAVFGYDKSENGGTSYPITTL